MGGSLVGHPPGPREQVKRFFDDTAEVKEKVVRAPAPGTWEAKLKDFRISYEGEVVEKAHGLTLEQVLPGLPPAGYGGSVPLLELCEGEVRERLENPLGNLLPEEELPERLPRPRILAESAEWHKIVAELHARGLIEPVDEPVVGRGGYISNGSFGVVKAGKFLPDGRPVLRLIMDLRHTNVATRIITEDIRSLTGAAALQHVVLPDGHVMRMSADDLVLVCPAEGLEPADDLRRAGALEGPWSGARGRDLRRGHSTPDGVELGGWSAAAHA